MNGCGHLTFTSQTCSEEQQRPAVNPDADCALGRSLTWSIHRVVQITCIIIIGKNDGQSYRTPAVINSNYPLACNYLWLMQFCSFSFCQHTKTSWGSLKTETYSWLRLGHRPFQLFPPMSLSAWGDRVRLWRIPFPSFFFPPSANMYASFFCLCCQFDLIFFFPILYTISLHVHPPTWFAPVLPLPA